MLSGGTHLYLFIDGYKQHSLGARKVVEVLVKDEKDNVLSTTRENVTLDNKDLQDYSALLLGLEKAKGMGASRLTLFVTNPTLCAHLNTIGVCADETMQDFHLEAERLIRLFESVSVEMKKETDKDSREFHA